MVNILLLPNDVPHSKVQLGSSDTITHMTVRLSGVFRGRATVRCPPLWPDHENFLPATLYEKVRFLSFSSENCKI